MHGSEMITCYENSDGELVVAEGNRRVCACKLLLHKELVPDDYKESFPTATNETINLYIHYPQAVDPSYLTDSWTIMKLVVARCLSI